MERRGIFPPPNPWTSAHIQAELNFRKKVRGGRRKLSSPQLSHERNTQIELSARVLEDESMAEGYRSKIHARMRGEGREVPHKEKVLSAIDWIKDSIHAEEFEVRGSSSDDQREFEEGKSERLTDWDHLAEAIRLDIPGSELKESLVKIEYAYDDALRQIEFFRLNRDKRKNAQELLHHLTIVRDWVYQTSLRK